MGYTIEYCRVFIRSQSGITPVILDGASNAYDTFPNLRRERRWKCFMDLFGVSEEELMKVAHDIAKSKDSILWYRNGREYRCSDIIRWMRDGISSADTLENILWENRLRSVFCYVAYQEGTNFVKLLEQSCFDTESFDAWIKEAKQKIEELYPEHRCFPIIRFWSENIHARPKILRSGKPIIIKYGLESYVSKIDVDADGNAVGISFSKDIKKAIRFENGDCVPDLRAFDGLRYLYAERQEKPFNAVLKITSGRCSGMYVSKRIGRRLYQSTIKENAKRYPDWEAALGAKKDIEAKFSLQCEICILSSELS